MKVHVGHSLRIDAPEFFKDPMFVAWLNNGQRKLTWHQGGEPTDWSDVVVLVSPDLSGEGSDSDMPDHIWNQILQACRHHLGQRVDWSDEAITVRLTNTDQF